MQSSTVALLAAMLTTGPLALSAHVAIAQAAASPVVRAPLYPVDSIRPTVGARGENITVYGSFPASGRPRVRLRRDVLAFQATRTDSAGADGWVAAAQVFARDTTRIIFTIPAAAALGAYDVQLTTQEGATTGAPLFVSSDAGRLVVATKAAPHIAGIYPEVNYADRHSFSFTLVGTGFGPVASDNELIVEKRGRIITCDGPTSSGCAVLSADPSGRELRVANMADSLYSGPLQLRVRVGDRESDPVAVTLSPVSRQMPRIASGVAVLALALLTVLLVSTAKGDTKERAATRYTRSFLVDAETNTLSLSKLQFYLWTVAGLLGYIYLTLARSWVQGNFGFADLPKNFPGIILVSATTGALAIGITSAKGSKGAGDQKPSWSDLITTGGVVVADRLQFLIWTVVGVVAFVLLTFSIDPGRIASLPDIPEGFLTLMGVSSAGYLGGKLGRKKGPVLDEVLLGLGSLILRVSGSGLSKDAKFYVDTMDPSGRIILGKADEELKDAGRPESLLDDTDPAFAKVLRLAVKDYPDKWLTPGEHELSIVNPDGQRATMKFTVPPSTATLLVGAEVKTTAVQATVMSVNVLVREGDGRPVAGALLTFAVDKDSGVLELSAPAMAATVQTVTTDARGVAEVNWKLPATKKTCVLTVSGVDVHRRPLLGSPQKISVNVTDAPAPYSVSAPVSAPRD